MKIDEPSSRDAADGPNPGSDRKMRYGPYLVILIDLLGQGEKLLELESIPMVPEQKDAVLAVLRDTAGNVRTIRQWLTMFLEGVSTSRIPPEQLPAHVREEYLEFRRMKFGIQMFSDTVIIFVPMFQEDKFEFARVSQRLWVALMTVANVMLTALAAGIPLRAGIDVGNGLDVNDEEIYGPVLARAYRLESRTAEYPRAAVGNGLVRYISMLETSDRRTPLGELAADTGADCNRLICAAPDDGAMMLDLLAPAVLQSGPHHPELPRKAVTWISSEIAKHDTAGNETLATRYRRLLQYFAVRGYPAQTAVPARRYRGRLQSAGLSAAKLLGIVVVGICVVAEVVLLIGGFRVLISERRVNPGEELAIRDFGELGSAKQSTLICGYFSGRQTVRRVFWYSPNNVLGRDECPFFIGPNE